MEISAVVEEDSGRNLENVSVIIYDSMYELKGKLFWIKISTSNLHHFLWSLIHYTRKQTNFERQKLSQVMHFNVIREL